MGFASSGGKQDNGLVKDVFTKETMKLLDGHMGIGHVRYPTAGSSTAQEAQPFFVNSPLGIYLVRRIECVPPSASRLTQIPAQIHNGNLTNAEQLRATLQTQSELSYQRHLRTESDSEVLLNIFADEIHRAHKVGAAA
jgi:amidophosphoribosyltransferase